MAKYLKLPVTGTSGPSVTIGIDDIAMIWLDSSSNPTTVTRISYANGKSADNQINITHTAMAANDYAVRDAISSAILDLQNSNWRNTIADLDLTGIKSAAGGAVSITGVTLS